MDCRLLDHPAVRPNLYRPIERYPKVDHLLQASRCPGFGRVVPVSANRRAR